MPNYLSNIAKSVLSNSRKKVEKSSEPVEPKVEEKLSFSLPGTYTITPFTLDYIRSDGWRTVRDFINTWLIRYQIDNNNKLHRSVSNDKSIGIVANLSGKVTAADEFRLFLLELEKNIGREIELTHASQKEQGR